MTSIEQTTCTGGYVPVEGPPATTIYATSVEEPRESNTPEEKE